MKNIHYRISSNNPPQIVTKFPAQKINSNPSNSSPTQKIELRAYKNRANKINSVCD